MFRPFFGYTKADEISASTLSSVRVTEGKSAGVRPDTESAFTTLSGYRVPNREEYPAAILSPEAIVTRATTPSPAERAMRRSTATSHERKPGRRM